MNKAMTEAQRIQDEANRKTEYELATKLRDWVYGNVENYANLPVLNLPVVHDTEITPSLGLYRFDKTGRHAGAKWFSAGNLSEMKALRCQAEDHAANGLEVRITNSGDNLLYHAVGGKVIYPADPEILWRQVGIARQEQR